MHIFKYKNQIIGVVTGFFIGLVLLFFSYRTPFAEHAVIKFLCMAPMLVLSYLSWKLGGVWRLDEIYFLIYFMLIGFGFAGKLTLQHGRKWAIIKYISIVFLFHGIGMYFYDAFLELMIDDAHSLQLVSILKGVWFYLTILVVIVVFLINSFFEYKKRRKKSDYYFARGFLFLLLAFLVQLAKEPLQPGSFLDLVGISVFIFFLILSFYNIFFISDKGAKKTEGH